MEAPQVPKMEKRIELEKRGRQSDEIEELNLDNCRATTISGLTDEFKNLVSLSLINVGLTSLKGFPNLPKLKKLELSDNRISGGLNLLHGCPTLAYLNLSGNKISTIETLEPLKQLVNLQNLDLFNCEVTGEEKYREKVFELLDGLVYLDGFDRDNMEADDEEEDLYGASSEGGDGEEGVSGEENELNGEDSDEVDDDDDDEDDDEDDEDSDLDGEEEEEEEEEEDEVSKGVKRKHEDEEKDEEEEEDEEEN